MQVFCVENVVGVDVRNLISFGGPRGEKTKGEGGVGMDYVQTRNHLERSTVVGYAHPHALVKDESQ